MQPLNELQLLAIKYMPYTVTITDFGYGTQIVTTGSNCRRKRSVGLKFLSEMDDKLILRPFSDLIHEIEHDGKTITPLIEIANIAGLDVDYIRTEGDAPTGATFVAYGKVGKHPRSKKTFQYFFEIDEADSAFDYGMIRSSFGETKTRFYPVKNQLAIIEKLHEMKIDIYGAIKKGLAVSIHDLK